MPRNKRQAAPPPPATAVPVQKRHGCLYYIGLGLLAFLALGICGALGNLMRRDTPATPASERAAIVDITLETPATTSAPPTATNAPPTATNPPPTATNAPPTATNAPPTATPSMVAELVEAPSANTNANLREGPGTDYPAIGSTVAGQSLELVGRNSAGDWLQLASGAWIAAALVANPPTDLPVAAVAAVLPGGNPTPAPEPVAAAPTPTWRKTVNGIEFASDCPCDQGNILNCGDFGILISAQACYLRCMELVGFDVHDMDRDNDGSACEWDY